MGGERQPRQLELVLSDRRRGEAPGTEQQGAEPLMAGIETGSAEKPTEGLMEEICGRENLKEALKRVTSNKGSPGIDGMTVEELPVHLKAKWVEIREQLISGEYRPQPVKRVEIAKPDGGVRKLGIPTVLDRFIQQAVMQVLQRRWDETFSESSYGFRPGRSAHQAVVKAQEHIGTGCGWVVDIDLEKFFDRVNHDRLMAAVAKREKDKRLLKLVRAYLNAGVMENGLVSRSEEGTPQGGPLSPLLSNLVLDELDKELEKRGHLHVRYADDCNIYVGSEKAGQRVMKSITKFIERKLKLKVNEAKSAASEATKRAFLGFGFFGGREPKRRISPKAMERFKKRVKKMTRRVRGASVEQVIKELTEYMRGWAGYFGHCQTPSVMRDLDTWTRHRVRSLIWAQWRNNWRRVTELLKAGADRDLVFNTVRQRYGEWRMGNSRVMRVTFDVAYFRRHGLTCLQDYCKP